MELNRNRVYWLLVAAAALWVGLTLLAPWARAHEHPAAPWLYVFFAPVCHQIAERSFHWLGHPLAVCHRCFGLYGGFLMSLLALPHLPRLRSAILERPRRVVLFALPLAADALVWENVAASRVATGVVASVPVALLVWVAAGELFRHTFDSPQGASHELIR